MWIALHTTYNWVNNLERSWYLCSLLLNGFVHTAHVIQSCALSHLIIASATKPKAFNSIDCIHLELRWREREEWLFAVNTKTSTTTRSTALLALALSHVRSAVVCRFGNLLRLNKVKRVTEHKQDQRQTISTGWLMSATIKRMLRF